MSDESGLDRKELAWPDDPSKRDARGRFSKGNPGGPGNPMAKRTAEIRSLLMNAVSDEDLTGIVRALVSRAKAGDVPAAREVLDRLAGKASQKLEMDLWGHREVPPLADEDDLIDRAMGLGLFHYLPPALRDRAVNQGKITRREAEFASQIPSIIEQARRDFNAEPSRDAQDQHRDAGSTI